jgi:Tol biopolymer transport system component
LTIHNLSKGTKVSHDLTLSEYHAVDCPLAWSNSGEFIALSDVLADELSSTRLQTGLSVLAVETGEIQHILYTEDLPYNTLSINWSPDDSWLAIETLFSAFRDIRLIDYEEKREFIIRLDGIPISNAIWREVDN